MYGLKSISPVCDGVMMEIKSTQASEVVVLGNSLKVTNFKQGSREFKVLITSKASMKNSALDFYFKVIDCG